MRPPRAAALVAAVSLLLAPLLSGALPGPVARVDFDADLELARGRVDPASGFVPARAPFEVRLDDEPVHFRIRSALLLPGASLTLRGPAGSTLVHANGRVFPRGDGRWAWEAPSEPGAYPLRIESVDGARVDVVALVLHPASRAISGVLAGYRIGSYRETPLRGQSQYLPPQGFAAVESIDEDILVSPHVTIGELLCKQPGDPRLVTFTQALLDKLETVLEEVNARGIEVGALTVMSGFRTPWYNRSIGNTTDYSRHLWGDAADIYIDRDGNGDMDDLNGDGRSNLDDARVLADIVDAVRAKAPAPYVPGGMSLYRRNQTHGPFVHLDARGEPARW